MNLLLDTCAALWIATAYVFRFSSASALVASLLSPVVLLLCRQPQAAAVFLVLALFLWWFHRANIGRLLAGTEGKIGQKA